MKKNKNIIALTMTLSMFSPIKSDNSIDETIIEIAESYQAIEESVDCAQLNIQNITEEAVTLENAVELLKSIIVELKNNNEEEVAFNRAEEVEEIERKLNSTEKDILTTLFSSLVSSIATEIQEYQDNEITEKNAIIMLQNCINNLAVGTKFTLNGTTYVIVDSSNNKQN